MSTFYVKNSDVCGDTIYITGEDVNHIKNVLRYKINDNIEICNESGIKYLCKISNMEKEKIEAKINSISQETTEANTNVTLFQGLPKSDKMDFIIQKNTELGIKSIFPIITDRVIVKMDEKNEEKKQTRWQKIAKEAATQSGRQIIPSIEKSDNLKNIIEKLSKYDIVIVPYECEKEKNIKNVLKSLKSKPQNIAIVIGPEGGFSVEDINALKKLENIQIVSLGSRILRTETAGIVTTTIVMYELDGFCNY